MGGDTDVGGWGGLLLGGGTAATGWGGCPFDNGSACSLGVSVEHMKQIQFIIVDIRLHAGSQSNGGCVRVHMCTCVACYESESDHHSN